MVKRRKTPLVPDGMNAAAVAQELRGRGLKREEFEALVLRFTPIQGGRRTLDEIGEYQGYTKGRASQLISSALRRLATTHQKRPLAAWLQAEVERKVGLAAPADVASGGTAAPR